MTYNVSGNNLQSRYMAKSMFVPNGNLFAWGYNALGQLGLSDQTNRYSPVQVGNLSTWIVISGSDHTVAIQSNGTLWSWGNNNNGQLGLSDQTNRYSPVQVGNLSTWISVACGGNHTLAVKNDGTLWAWGYSTFGQLASAGDKSTPVQIGTVSTWTKVYAQYNRSHALRSDGSLWAWGYGPNGELGVNNTTSRLSVPVRVGGVTSTDTWSKFSPGMSHNLAIKPDGTLWAWGSNSYGQMASTDLTNKYSPVQIGSESNWSKISAGYWNTLAIKNDGTLWSWGYNLYGQLAQSDTIDRSSPVQIGTLSNWSIIDAGYTGFCCAGIKTDGTLWAWGRNNSGQLGLSDTVDRSSPTQVGSLNNWNQVVTRASSLKATQIV